MVGIRWLAEGEEPWRGTRKAVGEVRGPQPPRAPRRAARPSNPPLRRPPPHLSAEVALSVGPPQLSGHLPFPDL